MPHAISVLMDVAPLLINTAAASLLICTCVAVASFLLRRRSLPLRHSVLLCAPVLAVACPVMICLAWHFEWGMVPFEMTVPSVVLTGQPGGTDAPQNMINDVFERESQSVSRNPVSPDYHSHDERSESLFAPASVNAEDVVVADADHSENKQQAPLLPRPKNRVAKPVAADSSATAETTPSAVNMDQDLRSASAQLPRWRVTTACVLITTWIAGSILLLMRLCQGMLVVRRLRRSLTATIDSRTLQLFDQAKQAVGITRPLRVCESGLAPAPLSLGVQRPVVVLSPGLSETLSDEQLCSVLTHECAHIARGDNFAALCQQLAAAIFWWNPLLHRINRTANRLREQICDDYVVHTLGYGRDFAEALVKVAEWCVSGRRTMPAVTMLTGKPGELPARLRRLADGTGTAVLRLGRRTLWMFAACACCGAGLLLIPVLRPMQAALVETRPNAVPIAQPADLQTKKKRTFSSAELEQLQDNDRFPKLIVATVLEQLRKQQPSLMTVEMTRRVQRRFGLITEENQIALSNRGLKWRQTLISSLERSFRLQFSGDDCRDGHQPSAKFFDRLKTLEWKLWMAAGRSRHLEVGEPRYTTQQAWLRKHILSLPVLRSRNGRVLYSQQELIAEYEALIADPLEPICKTAMSDSQFAEFQQKMLGYGKENEIQYAVAHIVRHEGWARYGTLPAGRLRYPAIQLPFDDVVASLGHHNVTLQLTFQSSDSDYFVPQRVRSFHLNRDGTSRSANDPTAADAAAVRQQAARRESLLEQVKEARKKRDQSLQPGSDHPRFEQLYQMAQLRLDQFDLEQATGADGVSQPQDVGADTISRLREATRIRWGRPHQGLQLGFGRINDRTKFSVGEIIPFQLYVRNALDEPLVRTVKYRDPESPAAKVDSNRRITVSSRPSGQMHGPSELRLNPGETQPLKNGRCLLDTSGLTTGNYYIEAYMIVTWPKGPDDPKIELARTPGWTEIPTDLAMRFELTSESAASSDLSNSGVTTWQSPPGVSWGQPVQGIQSGVRYVRGMQSAEFNDPDNWEWNDGDQVQSEVLIRNVSDRPRTISWMPAKGLEYQVLDASDCSVTDYDDYSALRRRSRVRGELDEKRTVAKVLQPGEFAMMARQDFEVRLLPEALEQMGKFPRANRIWVKEGDRCWYRPRVVVSMGAEIEASLQTGKLRLWMADPQNSPPLQGSERAPVGDGTISLSYDSFGASPRATFVFTPLNRNGKSLAKEVGNGEAAMNFIISAGTYRVSRLISVHSGRFVRTFECEPQVITVEPGQQTDVRRHRDSTHLVTAQHRIENFDQHKTEATFITVFPVEEGKLNTGEPAHYFDFLADREPLCATTCDQNGVFRIEPLPPGRYAVSVATFQAVTDADGNSTVALPWHVGCATFQVLGHSQEAYWYPSEVRLYDNWNQPTILGPSAASPPVLQSPDVPLHRSVICGRDLIVSRDRVARS